MQVTAGIPFEASLCPKEGTQLPHDIELFNASGDRDRRGWVSRKKAEQMVASRLARWIDRGPHEKRCLRRVAEVVAPRFPKAVGVTPRDMQVLAGLVGSQTEEFAVRERVEAWAGRGVGSMTTAVLGVGTRVRLKFCPHGEPGIVIRIEGNRAVVFWRDLDFLARHSPESLTEVDSASGNAAGTPKEITN